MFDDLFFKWGLENSLNTKDLDIHCTHVRDNNTTTESVRNKTMLYGCLQIVKKLHPMFDSAIRSILDLDANAVFLMPHNAIVSVVCLSSDLVTYI